MDYFAEDILNNTDEITPPDGDDHEDEPQSDPGSAPKSKRRGLRRGIFTAANIQDKLLDQLLQKVIPVDEAPSGQVQDMDIPRDSMPAFAERPSFNITTMSNNFRRFNARIGVVFKFQARMIRLLSWRRYSHTLSFLALYTFVCLDPYLLSVLPLTLAVLGIFIPSFMARHPAAPAITATAASSHEHHPNLGYPPRGPPLAPALTVKPVKELSRDFFRNMRDLQNSMEDFSVAHDRVVRLVVPATNFSDEALSSALFVLLLAAAAAMSIAAHLLPWRLLFLAVGWAVTVAGHPVVARALAGAHAAHVAPQEGRLRSLLGAWKADIILDEAPETREVEIFELQRRSGSAAGEWEAWVFSPSPYDPLSAPRITGERPRGTRFFEDVLPPDGWEWSGKKWALDLWSREWVEERIITGVEVETEGERWVYDMHNEHEVTAGVVEAPAKGGQKGTVPPPTVSWEEGFEGVDRRGEWRRRRWVRLVKRKKVAASG